MRTERTPEWRALERDALRYATRRIWHGFIANRGIDQAAALTFFLTLSVFPGLLAFTSAFALFDNKERALRTIVGMMNQIAPETLAQASEVVVRDLLEAPTPGLTLVLAIGLTIWTVSGYAMAFGRAVNGVYATVEGRRYFVIRAQMLLVAVLLIVCGTLAAGIILTTPTVTRAILDNFGLPSFVPGLWAWIKWPILAVLAVFIVAVLHYASPNLHRRRVRWVSLGAAFTIIVWSITSAVYLYYVDNWASYDRLYGFLAGIIITLVWLYLTNVVLVLGVEVDAELLRARQLLAGIESEESIQIALRTTYRNAVLARRAERNEREGRALRQRADEIRPPRHDQED